MKKILVLSLLLIMTIFPSCSSTEDVSMPSETEVPAEEIIEAAEAFPADVAEPAVEIPEEKEIEVEEEPIEVVPESPAIEEPVSDVVEVEVPEEEKTVEEIPVLKGKALVEQISEDEQTFRESMVSTAVDEPEHSKVETVLQEEVPEAGASDEKIASPSPEQAEASDDSAVPAAAPAGNDDGSVLDRKVDRMLLMVVMEILSVMIIYALSSVIRNKYTRPLSIWLSILLAVLFTAIPMLIAFLLCGWNNAHLMFLALLGTVLIFSSERGH